MDNHKKRSTFSGKLGYVLSAAGASVGLPTPRRRPSPAGNGSSGCTSQKRPGRRSDSLSYRAPQNLLFIKIDSKFYVITKPPLLQGRSWFLYNLEIFPISARQW